MIRLEVTAYEGRPPPRQLVGEFDEQGGTIGRGEGNTLVLPDPKRYISRTHASVVFRDGRYVLCDSGSASPVAINGKQLGAGREALLQDGDVVAIGNYTIRVVGAPSTSSSGGTVTRAASGPSSMAKDDPLAAFGAGSSGANPFSDLLSPPQSAAPARRPIAPVRPPEHVPERSEPPQRPRSADPVSVVIPEDFDPFADPAPEPSSVAKLSETLDFGPATRDQKIDDIFGLSPADGDDPLKPGSPLAEPLGEPGGSPLLDPLVAIGAIPARKPAQYPTQRDDTPEIFGSLHLPPPMSERMSPAGPGNGARIPEHVDRAGAANVESQHVAAARENSAPIVDAASLHAETIPPPPMPTTPNASGGNVTDALLQEFLTGAGIPTARVPGGLTPQLMHVLGQLFRESTQGTLDLLLARTTTKRQLRSTVTTIVARDNNPLKFSPSVEAAMNHLLAPHDSVGFMPPVRALKDAFDDLRAHEFGFMAGMRAALGGALARFNPTQLERRLTQKRVLDALLPMNRQARLWVLFGELYADISREAEDNFHSLFGAEFLKAYEEQIAKLEQQERKAND